MNFKNKRLYKNEEGTAVVWFIAFFFIIVGIMGVVIDGGILYRTKSELRKTANAAVLSGAQELKTSKAMVEKITKDTLEKNGEESSLKNWGIEGENKLTVTLERKVPLNFMKILNIDNVPINVTSSAAILPLTSAVGAVPLGIDKSKPLVFNKEYLLKVEAGDSDHGNFGILALSGPGAKLYGEDLMYGCKGEIKVGDVYETEEGNVAGKTIEGVNSRISRSPYQKGDTSHRDDPRIIMILIYEPAKMQNDKLEKVRVTGFAYFYLMEPMGPHDTSIHGKFIEEIGIGGTGSGETVNTGAYAIRLVE